MEIIHGEILKFEIQVSGVHKGESFSGIKKN